MIKNKPLIITGPHASGKTYIADILAGWFAEPHVKKMTANEFARDADPQELKVYKLVIVEEVVYENQLRDITDLFIKSPELESVKLLITTQLRATAVDEIDRANVDFINFYR